MKKLFPLAITLCLAACYAPLNNSGVNTTKAWLDIPAKKTDFKGSQYDSCYQFRLHFVPAEAQAQLDLADACIDRCCWRSEKDEVVLDFNKNFERNLKFYGRAEKYTPGKITLKISHSNLVNTTGVKISPRGAISANGTVKLKVKTVEDQQRLAQLAQQSRSQQARYNALKADRNIPDADEEAEVLSQGQKRAQELVQRREGTHIDRYFYELDKKYKQQGYVYIVGERFYAAALQADGNYRVSCRAYVQSGASATALRSRTVSCGVWIADLDRGTVAPQDGTARQIKVQQ